MTILYAGFISLIMLLLVLDLVVLNRKHETIGAAKALRQAAAWASVAFAFNVGVYFLYDARIAGLGSGPPRLLAVDPDPANPDAPPDQPSLSPGADPSITAPAPGSAAAPDHAQSRSASALDRLYPRSGSEAASMFLQGYLLELMLSLDNMMVIAIIISSLRVPGHLQHRVLFWGIFGAVALRGLMIWLGYEMVTRFHWILYLFGAFLVWTAIKLLSAGDDDDQHKDISKTPVVRWTRRIFPVTDDYVGARFFTRVGGRLAMTPLMLCLICIEVSDVIFAVDSIPAIFSTTADPFLVLTSNCFAILGLRALYFAVHALTKKFRYLKQSMVLILAFIGIKMLVPGLAELYPAAGDLHINPQWSLAIIGLTMVAGVLVSVARPGGSPNGHNPTNSSTGAHADSQPSLSDSQHASHVASKSSSPISMVGHPSSPATQPAPTSSSRGP